MAQSLSTTRTLPSDWWGTNAHDLTHGHELMGSDSMDYKNWKKTKVEVLRHPADGYINDWDWDKGYFITQGKFPAALPQFDLNKHKNLFTDFQQVAGTVGAGINIDINPVSSNLSYQLTGLKFASGIGLRVLNVELGEEIYGNNILQNYVYPSAAAYADTCRKWIDSVKKYFPAAKVAVVGAPTDGEVRKIGWNTDLLSSAGLINKNVDAVTLHYYPGSGITSDSVGLTKQEIPTMMEYPYLTNHCLQEDIAAIHLLKPAAKIWITEYNLTEKSYRVHGSWSHAMFTTFQTMLLLEDSSVTQLLLHNTSSDGVRGLLFQDDKGLNQSSYNDFKAPYTDSNPHNEPWQYTALGNSMRLLAMATRGMNRAAQIHFANAPVFNNNPDHKMICGWIFADGSNMTSAPSRNAIILNLDSSDHNISLGSLNAAGGQYEQMWSYEPLVFAGGNAVYNSNDHAAVTTPNGYPTIHTSRNPAAPNASQRITASDTAQFKLRAYSITYIHHYSGGVTLTASADTICTGQFVTLKATGGAYYTWSVTNGNYTLDGDTSNFISVHPTATGTVTSTYTFKVKAWNNGGTSNGTATKSIVVRPVPNNFAVTHTPDGCNVMMAATESAYSYTWFPATGLSATTGQSVTSANNPRTYVVTASFNPSNQCTYSISHVASRIDSGNHFFSFQNLQQAYMQGCDTLKFGKKSSEIRPYPLNGYVVVKKYNEAGQFIGQTTIHGSTFKNGPMVPVFCDTAGTYSLTYFDTTTTCPQSDTLKQIIFVNRVRIDASYTTLCPNHPLHLQQSHFTDNAAGFSFYWSGPVKHLYTKKDPAASDTIHVNTSYTDVWFRADTVKNYTVTLTVKKGTKVCSKNTITLTVSGKCSCTQGDSSWVDVSASQLLSDLKNIQCNTTYSGSTRYKNKIYLYGTFTVDQDVHLLNTQADSLTLVFGSNAQVNVNAYKTLELDSVHCYSCTDSMWNGIVEKGAGSAVITNRSWIEDAKNAIYADYGGTLTVSKTRFEDNFTGIWFEGKNSAYAYSGSTVVSSQFKTVNGLKKPYLSYGKGYRGIRLDTIAGVITIGSATAGQENKFDSLYSGISGFTYFDAGFYRNTFSHITGKYGGSLQPYEGKAIYLRAGTVVPSDVLIMGTGKNDSSAAVNKCDYGFFITGYSNTTISDYYLDQTKYGLQIENASGGTMDVYSNKMTGTRYGALFLLNKYCTQNIYDNDISVVAPPNISGTAYFGISIQDFTGAYSTNQVYNNTVADGRYGIYLLNNGTNSNIHDNTINMPSTQTLQGKVYGIYAEACSGTKINRNTITGNVADFNVNYKKHGIMLYQSQNCEVTCDSVNKIGYAFYFKGNCSNTLFRGNKMGVSGGSSPDGVYYGIYREYFNGSDAVGIQGDNTHSHSNYTYGPFTNSNGWCGYHLNTVSQPIFFYNPNDPSYLKTFTQGPPGASLFGFTPSTSAQLFNCTSFDLRNDEEDSAKATIDSSKIGANEVEQWMNNRVLFEQLATDTTQIEESGLEIFYDTTSQSGIGKLAEFTDALQADSALQNNDNIEDIAYINEAIPESLYYEENEKKINEIFLNTVAVGVDTFSDDQRNFITALAFSCPSVDGNAVFKARPLYEMLVDTLVYFDDSLCTVSNEKIEVNNEQVSSVNCYPNPASDYTLIQLNGVYDGDGELIISNFMGQEIRQMIFSKDASIQLLKVDAFPQGIYRLRFREGEMTIAAGVLVIAR
ncbi:MAG: hypothetical protein K1X63_16105 [Chitinophagales bacterium]|nr:hypothetical protein [Chitinophagales bacterium]